MEILFEDHSMTAVKLSTGPPSARRGLVRIHKSLLVKVKLAAAIEKRLVAEVNEDALCAWLVEFGIRNGPSVAALTNWDPGEAIATT